MTNLMVPAASYPPLQRTQGRGTHSSEVGRENTKSRATRPVVFIYDNRECDACRSKPRMLIVQGEYVAKYLAYCAGWLALAFVVMAVMAGDAFSYYRLRSEGTLTDGNAVATAPHNQIKYSFKVDDVVYQGLGMAGFGTPPYEKISINDKLPVYYLPKDPKINCLGSPEKLFSDELPPLLLAATLFPSLIIAMVVFRYKRRLRGGWPRL